MVKTRLRLFVKFYRWHIKHLRSRKEYYKRKISLLHDWIRNDTLEIKHDKETLQDLEARLYKLDIGSEYPELEGGE